MYTLILLSVLCLVEFIYLWMKWGDVQDLRDVGSLVGQTITKGGKGTQVGKRIIIPVRNAGNIFLSFMAKFKKLLIIPIVILFIINLVVSIILGTFVRMIVELIN